MGLKAVASSGGGVSGVSQIIAGTNITITPSGGTGNVTINSSGGGSGITRSVNSVSTNTNAGATAATDYVYFCNSTMTLILPTAVSNTNRYTAKNYGTGVITLATTSSQTIDGALTLTLGTQYTSYDFISNGTNWGIV